MTQQNKKERNPRYVTATGLAVYPYLLTPDTKYNPDGDYKVTLRLKPDAEVRTASGKVSGLTEAFLEEMAQKSIANAKENNKGRIKEADLPYSIDEDTGEVLVNFKLKAKGKVKKTGEEFTQSPALFDARGKPFEGDALWGGSAIKVSFEVVPFYTKMIGAGISLRLKAAQVITLVAGGNGGSASDSGFGCEEADDDEEDFEDETDGFGSDESSEDDDASNF